MKICIDGFGINKLQGTGLYSYTYEILNSLLKVYPQPYYELIWDDSMALDEWNRYNNLSYISLALNRASNDYTSLEHHIANNKIRLYHSPNSGFSIPQGKACKYIMTVHDLLSLSNREYTDSKYYDKFMTVFPNSVKKCDRIIAVSDFIKRELIDYLKITEDKIVVIHPGCSEQFIPLKEEQHKTVLRERFKIESSYILFAGSIHTRKNLTVLLTAFKKVLQKTNGLKLVIAGKCDEKRNDYFLKLKDMCRELDIEDSVIFTGKVDYKYMPYLYNGAACAVNLSSYEGFPLTTIEAMSCGVPAICTKSSSFLEAAGDGAVYLDAIDDNELCSIILNIIDNKNYCSSLIKKGMEQSKKYKWDNSIKKLISVYESAAYGS